MRPFEVAVAVEDRESVVNQREVDGCHGDTRAVGQFVDEEVVAGEESFFQRRGGDGVVLPDEIEDEIDQYQGVDDSVDPRHDSPDGTVFAMFPPGERDISGDVDVEDEEKGEQ